MRMVIAVITAFIFLACKNNNGHADAKWLPASKQATVIILQPFGQVQRELLGMLKDSIPNYYPVTVRITAPAELPANSYYQPRNRYRADSILIFLNKNKPKNVRIVTGITGKDISATKGDIVDYGIMGFGYQPGYVNVVSTYRLQTGNPSTTLLMQRLLKTVVHEIGHNFGLPHCPNPHCIMADAKGKLRQDEETGLCGDCRKKLKL